MLTAPNFLIGEKLTSGGYTKTEPRKWSDAEVAWCLDRKKEGFSNADIANALQRSEVSVQIKLKRQTKSNDSYNEKFREIKYLANEGFAFLVQPKTVLDVYAGNSWWVQKANTLTNDIDEKFHTDYSLDAFELMCRLYLEGRKFDVIDLDPYGSAHECFDFAFRMARKGVVISFGEWGHKRWKRTDFVSSRYGIESLEDFLPDAFIQEAQRVARMHKKKAVVSDVLQYSNFLRVYFTLEPFKETSQWNNREENNQEVETDERLF
jgi:hypothetical protein